MIFSLLFACADPPPPEEHHLSDLFRPIIRLNTGYAPGGAEQVQLFVHPEFPGVCHPIKTLDVTMDGKPMTRLHGRVEGATPYDRDCAVFEFTIDGKDVVAGPKNEVVVTDGVSTFRMVVDGIFLPRTISYAGGPVKPGDTVTLAWAPATDTIAADAKAGVELKAGSVHKLLKRPEVTFAPGTISFAMPEGLTGDVEVSVFGTESILPPVTTCEGAHKCEVSRTYDVPPITLKVAK